MSQVFSFNEVVGKKESRCFSLIYNKRNLVSVGSNRSICEARLTPGLRESFGVSMGMGVKSVAETAKLKMQAEYRPTGMIISNGFSLTPTG